MDPQQQDKIATPATELETGNPSSEELQLLRARVQRNIPLESDGSTPVFVVDDSFFRERIPRSTHWSIAWSDLMMTMFVLFLTLFVYQVAHREFLTETRPEVVAGQVMTLPPEPAGPIPFHPIHPSLSEKKADVLKRLETDSLPDKDLSANQESAAAPEQAAQALQQEEDPVTLLDQASAGVVLEPQPPETPEPVAEEPATPPQPKPDASKEIITDIYDLSRQTLSTEKLDKFASIELIPDKTMRIILTGDLLFDSGQAELTANAQKSLRKLGAVIRNTPYMINVTGHTDSQPVHTPLYPTNWELSVARASRVARFLIEDVQIPAAQIVVTGYSYFRPVKPNTNAENRSANRRVEIFLSKQLPDALPPTPENLN